jgi:hypothetical protein
VVLGEDEVEGLDDGPMNGEELILVWKKWCNLKKKKMADIINHFDCHKDACWDYEV